MNPLIAIQEGQRLFQDEIATLISRIAETGEWVATLTLAGIGFLYGLLHAAGPGHGKVVIAGYMAGSGLPLRRALGFTFASALLQSLVAIAIVGVFVLALHLSRSEAESFAEMLELASFTFITLIGAHLVWRGVRSLRSMLRAHHHHHDGDCCSHHHLPDAPKLSAASSRREQILLVFSVGMRPCSGGLVLLIFSAMLGVWWAGVLAVIAMGFGVAIATSILVVAALGSAAWAKRFAARSDDGIKRFQAMLSILCGLAVMAVGILFLLSALPSAGAVHPPHPLFTPVAR